MHSLFKALLACLMAVTWTRPSARAAVYQETGGQVVIEAEHFHERTRDPNAATQHWHIVPDEDGIDEFGDVGDPPFTGARADRYMQLLPNSGSPGKASNASAVTRPWMDYKVNIETTGTYRLWLRWNGYDGGSDSMHGAIVELRDGVGGAVADWYRYARGSNSDFQGWHGSAGFERTDASGSDVNATWNITKPGVYTIRLAHREDGVAVDALILQLSSLASPTLPGPAESGIATSYVIINQQPKSVTVAAGQTASFTVTAEGSGTVSFQWQKKGPSDADFTNIPGATSASFTTAAATGADNGTIYRVVASIPGKSLTSSEATLTVDVAGPTLVSAGTVNGSSVVVRFNEPVDKATAETTGNYSLSSGTISSATLLPNGTTVALAVSGLTANSFTVTVNNVKDLFGNVIAANAQVTGNKPAAPLTAVDVGDPGTDPLEPGATFSSGEGSYEVIAGGSDIWGNADHFHFTHSQRTGDFDIRVRVKSLVQREASTKAGFIVRESLDADSRNHHAIVMPPDARNIYETGTRADTGGATAGWGVLGGANGNIPATFPNSWVRLKRVENTFKAYASTNGQDWTLFGQNTPDPPYPATVLVGLATTSHNNNPGQTTFAEYTNFGDVPDTNAPVLLSIKHVAPNVISLSFDEALEGASGQLASNYSLDQGATISSVTLGADLQTVTVKTAAALTPGTTYTLTLNNLKDRAIPANTIAANTQKTFRGFELRPGVALFEIFEGLGGGTAVNELISSAKYQANAPDRTALLTAVNTRQVLPTDSLNNYGGRISGFITVPTAGQYDFFLRSDDASRLFLSTDDNPANLALIAEETDCCDAFQEPGVDATTTAAPIQLQANKRYAFLLLYKEGGGGDFAQIALREFNDGTPADQLPYVGSQYLSAMIDPNKPPTVTLTAPANGASFSEGANITLTATATDADGTIAKVEFFQGATKIGEAASAPYTITWSNVVKGRYALTAKAADNIGAAATSDRVTIKVGQLPDLVLFVAGTTPPNASDLAIIARVESFGFEVRVVEDVNTQTSDADGAVLVIVSSTSNSGDVLSDYRDVTIPAINWEQALQDDFNETLNTDGTDRGTLTGQTDLDIVNATHPMSGGLTAGTHTVADSPVTFSWGLPAASATLIATIAGDDTKKVIYGYEKGAMMVNNFVAPARRVHLFLENDAYADLNAAGKKLVDAAISWALDRDVTNPPPKFNAPTLQGANITLSWTGTGILEEATNIAGPWSTAPSQANPQTVPATGLKFFRLKR